MSASRTRIARTAAGIACIAAATCALVWFAFQFAPGEPRERAGTDDGFASSIASTGNGRYVAESVVDIPFGETFRTEGLDWGKWFSVTEEERASWTEEERQSRLASGGYRYESDGIEIAARGLRTVSLDAFAEWYPHYVRTTSYTEARKHECKVLPAEITVTNASDRAQTLPRLVLWSEDFNGANDVLENGAGVDAYLFGELHGEPQEGFVAHHLPDGWDELAPGETRSWTVPSLVYKSAFRESAAYDDVDPSRFCLAVADYDPPTIYRLWLG